MVSFKRWNNTTFLLHRGGTLQQNGIMGQQSPTRMLCALVTTRRIPLIVTGLVLVFVAFSSDRIGRSTDAMYRHYTSTSLLALTVDELNSGAGRGSTRRMPGRRLPVAEEETDEGRPSRAATTATTTTTGLSSDKNPSQRGRVESGAPILTASDQSSSSAATASTHISTENGEEGDAASADSGTDDKMLSPATDTEEEENDDDVFGSVATNTDSSSLSRTATAPLRVAAREQSNSSNNRAIAFVHVGKAGGESIKGLLSMGCQLRKNEWADKCWNELPVTQLNVSTVAYMHGNLVLPHRSSNTNTTSNKINSTLLLNSITTFLINVRHPLDRTISWYGFASPYNCNRTIARMGRNSNCVNRRVMLTDPKSLLHQFYSKCFPTLESFALSIRNNNNTTATRANDSGYSVIDRTNITSITAPTSSMCQTLGYRMMQGQFRLSRRNGDVFATHMISNYHWYRVKTIDTYPDKEVLVVRTNSLWQDLTQIEFLLGGTGEFGAVAGARYSHGSEAHKNASKALSDHGTQILCCGLKKELLHYKAIFDKAANFNATEKAQEWQNTVQRCRFSSWEHLNASCSELVVFPIVGARMDRQNAKNHIEKSV
jgi:Sulfotransferase family